MPATPTKDRPNRRWLAGAGAGALIAAVLPLTGALAAPLTVTTLHDPPRPGHDITAFPSRDFISVSGYGQDETVTVEVHHATRGGAVVSSQAGLVPQDDPATAGFDGTVEVNHPGGGCWVGVTPDLVPGDLVRVVVDSAADQSRVGIADQTTVADVVAGRPANPAPGTIVVKGTARAGDGSPLPLDQIEQRLVAPGELFALGGRRTLQAPGSPRATLVYDAAGSSSWTATYTGLSANDVTRALGAESRVLWLGRDPLGLNPGAGAEVTIFETGAGVVGGPAAPCTAPKEKLPPLPGQDVVAPSTPTGLTATVSEFNKVTLTWEPSTDNDPAAGVTNYGVFRNGVPIWTVQNADGSAPAPTAYVDTNVPPGDYAYTVDAADAIDNRSEQSLQTSVTAAANPATTPDLPINEPPVGGKELIGFPSRDFMDAGGFAGDETVTAQVIRNGRIVSDSTGLVPTAGGTIEVNHPGGGCWNGTTPELRAGDQIRTLTYGPDVRGIRVLRSVDQTTVANVTAQKAVLVTGDDPATAAGEGSVEVHGTAAGPDGLPLPIGNIEQRLIATSAEPFVLNGRRALLAPGDGTLAYDTPGATAWTATYTGLQAGDVTKALAVESRILWLGRDPLAGAELTIFEVGLADPPGPAAGICSAPLEPLDTTPPSRPSVSATPSGPTKEVALAWTASNDDTGVYGYRLFRDDKLVRAFAGDVTAFTDTGVGPGSHSYAVEAFDSASARGAGVTDVEKVASGLGLPYGNTSDRSVVATVTMPDVTAPSAPANLVVSNPVNATGAATNNARLAWDPATDDVAVTGYRVFRKDGVATDPGAYAKVAEGAPGSLPRMVTNAAGKVVYTDTGRVSGSTYTYYVVAYDAAANPSGRSSEVSVKIGLDTTAPTAPANLMAINGQHGEREVSLTWEASTDDFLVTQYAVYRSGTAGAIARVSGDTLAYLDTVPGAQTYTYTVDAADSAPNRSARSAGATVVVANEPPADGHAVVAFPNRDFVEASGFTATEGKVTVSVLRNGVTVSRSNPLTPVDDPATTTFDGIVEVNHIGGIDCWTGVTPDLRAGDVVRATNAAGIAHQITVQGVTAQRPRQVNVTTVQVKGTAASAFGGRLPLGELEQRLITSADAGFQANGRRALLAPGDGTLVYDDTTGASWTATYTGLSSTDVTRALGAESRVLSLGRQPLAGNELTIAENGPGVTGGPADPACAPLEASAPRVSWTPSSLAFGSVSAVPAATGAAKTVIFTNAGTSPVDITAVYLAGANHGDYTVTAGGAAQTLPAGASTTVSVAFSPKAVGARPASLNFMSNGANTGYQTVNLTGNGVDAAAPSTTGVPVKALVTDAQLAAVNGSSAVTVPVSLRWTPSTGHVVTRYELERSVAGGVFGPVPAAEQPAAAVFDTSGAVTAVAASSTIVRVTPGSSHRYRVRACSVTEGITNCSAYVTAAAFTLAAFQENNGSVSYRSPWSRTALAGSYGGSVSSLSVSGSGATLKTTGTGFQLVSTRGPDRGNAQVLRNGTVVATVSLYAASVQPARVVYSVEGLANATYELELRPLGTRTSPSTANRVDLDAFLAVR